MPPPYVADTNVYVTATNDASFRHRFEAFIRQHGPLIVSTIAVAEVLIGIGDRSRHSTVVQALTRGTVPVAPSVDDWIQAGGVVGGLGGDAITKSRSLWNDALLAAQCARLGATLVTGNLADFRRLGRSLPVRVVTPFPSPPA